MTEDKTQAAIQLGVKARLLLEDETLQKAFAEVEKTFIDRWKNTTDATERERCWMAVNIAENIRAALCVFVDNGKISQGDLDLILAQAKAA